MSLMFESIQTLCVILVLAYLLARISFFSEEKLHSKLTVSRFVIAALIFTLIALYGTLFELAGSGGHFDTRVVGIALSAFLLDLPISIFVLVVTALVSVFTSLQTLIPDFIAFALAFALARLMMFKVQDYDPLLCGIMVGAVELLHMLLIFVIAQPAEWAKEFVYTHSYPTIVMNGIAVMVFLLMIIDQNARRRLWEKRSEARTQLDSAQRIQETLLDKNFFVDWRIDLHAFLRPAYEVGGDLYGYTFEEGRYFIFIVGDVSGKGIPASITMSRCLTAFNVFAHSGVHASELLTRLSGILQENNRQQMFVTAIVGVLDAETGHLVYSNAGHTVPLAVCFDQDKPENITVRTLERPKGGAMGIVKRPKYQEIECDLKEGEFLFLYSDGALDARNGEDKCFGAESLKAALAQARAPQAQAINDTAVAALESFQGEAKQFDDIALMCIGWRGNPLSYSFGNTLDNLIECEQALRKDLELRTANADLINDVLLVVEEVISNTIKYGYLDGRQDSISLVIAPWETGPKLRITDRSDSYDPFATPEPDLSLPGSKRPQGKLGIHVIRPVVESHVYDSREGMNTLELQLRGDQKAGGSGENA